MGTMTGGAKLQAFFADLARKVADPQTVQVGFLEGSTYPDGTSLPLVAALDEFGVPSRGQPPRPFMRATFAAHKDGWGPALAGLLKANGYDATAALDTMGEGIAGQLEQTITDFTDPPNAPSTVARKGFAKPLTDTGHLKNSIAHRVVDGIE